VGIFSLSPGTPGSTRNKTDHQETTEILWYSTHILHILLDDRKICFRSIHVQAIKSCIVEARCVEVKRTYYLVRTNHYSTCQEKRR
jgi:hypothetical protein